MTLKVLEKFTFFFFFFFWKQHIEILDIRVGAKIFSKIDYNLFFENISHIQDATFIEGENAIGFGSE